MSGIEVLSGGREFVEGMSLMVSMKGRLSLGQRNVGGAVGSAG
jgi:hypothetical protein